MASVVARFDGGNITSDAGGLLLRETERLTGIIRQFAACFSDHRSAFVSAALLTPDPPITSPSSPLVRNAA